ncbi:beta-1,4-galactosyltransferase galt-1-like [Haliotis asinina]|uniref:beta-1,4-galactosyltransferase galt-1-like n=1 Tax=Haliotis asinina TaxID=109174 RepID=UPI0035318FE6
MGNRSQVHVSSRGKDCCGSLKETDLETTEGEDYYRLGSPYTNGVDPHLYVFSAHFDVKRNVVDILGTALRSQLFQPVCVFVTDDRRNTRSVSGSVQSLHLSHNKKYTELAVHCPLTHAHLTPSFLRLLPSTPTAEAKTVPVQHPTKEYRNVTVCYPAGHSSYSNSDEFVQSMAMNRILGADKAFWYNHSISANMRPAVDHFVRCGHLEVIPARVPNVVNKGIHYFGQIVTMHDCFYRNRYTSRYIVFQDMDEVMVPYTDSNWLTLLERLEHTDTSKYSFVFGNSFSTESKIGSFVFRNSFFAKSRGHVKSTMKHGYIKLLSHFFHGRYFPYYERSKYIVIPDTIDILEVHGPRHRPGFVYKLLDVSDGVLHHYRLLDGETYSKEDKSIMRFSSELRNLVNTTWQCIGNSV